MPSRGTHQPDLFPLSTASINRCRGRIEHKTVYISHPERADVRSDFARRQPHETINLTLRRKTRDALHIQGYAAELRGPDEGHPTTHWLVLSCDDHTITIEYRHTLTEDGRQLEIEASAKMSGHSLDSTGEMQAEPRAVQWSDYRRWNPSLDTKDAAFTLARMRLLLRLGLSWTSPSFYSLHVEIVSMPADPPKPTQGEE